MTTVYLGLGSNLGDRDAMLRAALSAIDALPNTRLTEQSPVYETPPMGPQDQGAFLNMAASIQTQHDPRELVEALQAIESALGRSSAEARRRWGPREIDIDVLLFGERVIDEPGLTIPHAGLADRWFVLKPLADLAPKLIHPTLGRTIAELLQAVATPDHAEATPR